MKIVKLVFDGNRTRLLDEVKVDPSCTVDHDGFVWTQDSTFKPFDAVEIEGLYNHDEDFHSDDSVSVVHTKNGTKRYKHIGEEMKDDKPEVQLRPALPPTSTPTAMPPAQPPMPTMYPPQPLSISLIVAENIRGDLKCMDLFNQLLKSEPFQDCARQDEHHRGMIHWMQASLRNMEQ